MFLHSGASLHGHEYSARRPSPQPPQKHIPFLRSALRPRADADSKSYAQSPVSAVSSPGELPVEEPYLPPTPLRRRPGPDVLKRDLSVRFRDQLMDQYDQTSSAPVSEDEESLASELSDATETSTRRRRPKRTPRQSTRFALAQPAPQLRTKQRRLVQLRPRLLLQLQLLGDKRAMPALDVVPSSLVAGSIIIPRLVKRFPRAFRTKPELGQNDVLIVRSEDYDSHGGGADDSVDHSDVLGVISTVPQGGCNGFEIVMEDGSTWAAGLMTGGSYEFIRVDMHGITTTARWIRKNVTPSRRSSLPAGSPPPTPEYKWTFSIIDPSTRRHPIMAVMRSNTLEVFDTYNTMSTSSGRFPPTRAFGSEASAGSRSPRTSFLEERVTLAVSEEHKRLMLATGIYVSLRQAGWPDSANPKMGRTTTHCRSVSSGSTMERPRTFPTSYRLSPPSSRPTSPRCATWSSNDASTTASHSPEAAVPLAASTPQRAMSTGAAYMRSRKRMSSGRSEEGSATQEKLRLQQHDDEEKTHTCRIKIRHLTQKLFHRKTLQTQREDALNFKLEE